MKLKTRTNQPVYYKLPVSSDIQHMSDDLLNSLRVGDVVQKKTGNQKHCYIVTYKEEKKGICLTYTDASCVETISYDYTDGHWIYNSKDVMPLGADGIKNQDIQVNGITSKGIANTGGLANIGDVAISGNLSVQGEGKGVITGNEILELMPDEYEYAQGTQTKGTFTPIYVGAVKTGNKLTLVIFGQYVKDEGATGYESIGGIIIPQSIASKIIPFTVDNLVDARILSFARTNNSALSIFATIHKYSATKLTFEIPLVNDLLASVDYYVRYECTFLLSDSLAE